MLCIIVDDDHEEDLTCLECGFIINKDVIFFIDDLPNAKGTKDNSCVGAAELSSTDRALITAYREIAEMSVRLNKPKILVDKAATLFKRVHDSVLNGYSNDAIISVCIYIVCQQDDIHIRYLWCFKSQPKGNKLCIPTNSQGLGQKPEYGHLNIFHGSPLLQIGHIIDYTGCSYPHFQ